MPIIHASSASYSPAEERVLLALESIVEVPLVLITRRDDFVFNEDLKKLDKYVLVNMSEWGWNFSWEETPVFGKNAEKFPDLFPGSEWNKFNDWVCSNQPILTLQRELLQKDVWYDIKPIEYPFFGDVPPIQTREEFESRPINVYHYFGRSNEDRITTHANFWLQSQRNGAAVCDNIYYLNDFVSIDENPNKWVSLHINHYNRHPLENILFYNGLSKLSLSMPGCGLKCFRSAEAPINSIMLMEENDLAWSFPWINGVNCITYKDDPIPAIEAALKKDLYPIYCAGVENARNYQVHNYTSYLENLINSVL